MRVFVFFVSLLFLSPALAQEATREAQVGMLNCTIEGGTGFIVGSTKTLDCVFERSDGKPNEHYAGEIRKFGIDIGRTTVTKLAWAIFAPSKAVEVSGRLAGSYGGVTGEATVGVGLGGNILVGGFEESIALQPFSLQVQEGLNIVASITGLNLTAK